MVETAYAMPPELSWDQETLTGDAYPAFGWGVNVIEVEVDPVSCETRVTGAWGVYDVGVPIDERVVNGQIQGGMSQALGYASSRSLRSTAKEYFGSAPWRTTSFPPVSIFPVPQRSPSTTPTSTDPSGEGDGGDGP